MPKQNEPQVRRYLVNTDEKLAKAWEYIKAGNDPIGFDTETFGPNLKWRKNKTKPDPYRHRIAGFSLSRGPFAVYIPVRHTAAGIQAELGIEYTNVTMSKAWAVIKELLQLAETGREVWLHNAAYDLNVLINEGLYTEHRELPKGLRDSQVAAWLGFTKRGKDVALKKIAGWLLGYKGLKSWDDVANGRQANVVDPAELYNYAALDAWLTATVGGTCWARLEKYDLVKHYLELDLPLVEVTRGMARAGMARDEAVLENLRVEWTKRRDAARREFAELTVTDVEIGVMTDVPTGEFFKTGKRMGQPKTRKEKVTTKVRKGADVKNDVETSRWCYEYLKWWPIPEAWDRRKHEYVAVERNDRGVYSVKSEYIRKFTGLAGEAGQAAKLRLLYQKYSKLISTYLDVMIEFPRQYGDGLLHPSLNITGTMTQRFSGSGPNFQNIPARDITGTEIRQALMAPIPGWTMVVRDYSQIEIRLQADIAKDEPWMTGYQMEADWGVKFDLHQQTADILTEVLSKPIDRKKGKEANLSVQYGVSAETLAPRIGMSRDEAQQVIDAFYKGHPRISRYQRKAEAYAGKHGYIPTKDGFKRFNFVKRWLRREQREALTPHDRRAAANTPIQGWSAGIIKAAMIELWRKWVAEGIYGKFVMLLNSVHDEIVTGCDPAYADRVAKDMDAIMTKPRWGITVPVVVEGKTGTTWADAK